MNCPDKNELTATKIELARDTLALEGRESRESRMQWRLRRLRAARRASNPKREQLEAMSWLRTSDEPRN